MLISDAEKEDEQQEETHDQVHFSSGAVSAGD